MGQIKSLETMSHFGKMKNKKKKAPTVQEVPVVKQCGARGDGGWALQFFALISAFRGAPKVNGFLQV